MRFEAERLSDKLQIPQADFDLPRLDFGQVAAIDAHSFGQLKLRPPLALPQVANSPPEANADVGGHPLMLSCRLSTTNRL